LIFLATFLPSFLGSLQGFGTDALENQKLIWNQTVAVPWQSLIHLIRNIVYSDGTYFHDWISLSVACLALTLSVALWRSLPRTLSLYGWSILLISFALFDPIAPLRSLPRYVLLDFPLWIGVANWLLLKRWFKPLLLSLFTILQFFMLWLYTHWYWTG
jgi:hypothetical protein